MCKNGDLYRKEMKYVAFVEEEAMKLNKIFILDSGEGRDLEDIESGWYVEDLSGWLIDPNQKEEFLLGRDNGQVYKKFDNEYIFVEWYKDANGIIGINFIKYPSS